MTMLSFARTLALAAVSGLALAPSPALAQRAARADTSNTIVVVGRLTDEGVECRALRTDDGLLYTLNGDLKRFKTGQKVRVTGQKALASFCMQGITIDVRKIRPAR